MDNKNTVLRVCITRLIILHGRRKRLSLFTLGNAVLQIDLLTKAVFGKLVKLKARKTTSSVLVHYLKDGVVALRQLAGCHLSPFPPIKRQNMIL